MKTSKNNSFESCKPLEKTCNIKKIIWFLILFKLCFIPQYVFAKSIWFTTNKPGHNSDGSIFAELQICSDSDLLEQPGLKPLVFGNEVPSKWNKNYHKGNFILNPVDKGEWINNYIVNSTHSIRYGIKAIFNNVLSDGRKVFSCAKINLFLYGKRGFDPLNSEHDVIEKMEFNFPFEIVDKNVAYNYWIQVGQKLNLLLLFSGKPLSNNKLTVFDNKTICGEYFTDEEGVVKFELPFPKDNPFKHTRDVCHYRIETEHEQNGILYYTTLTLLVHPQRKNSNFSVGLYTLFGGLSMSLAFVVYKRKRAKSK